MAKLLLPLLFCTLLALSGQSQATMLADNSSNPISKNSGTTATNAATEFSTISPEDKKAEEAYEKGDPSALKIYQKETAKNSQDKVASIGLIRAAIQQKQYAIAAKELARYKNTFGVDDKYLTEQARYYSKTGQQQQALTILNPLLQKDPTNDTLLDIKADALANAQTVAAAPAAPQPAAVAKKAKPSKSKVLATHHPVTKIPHTNKALTKTNKLTNSYMEAGVEHDIVSKNYGNWFNQYAKVFAQVDEKNAWYGEFYHDSEYFEHGNYAKVEQTHIFNEDYYSTVSLGLSDNSFFIPQYYVGGTIFRKLLDQRQLVPYVGVHAYWWRPRSSSEDINPGFVYYFKTPWIIEIGAYINRTNPGVIYTSSEYIALTQGREKEHYVTVRIGFGRESYLPLENNVAVVGYPSQVITVTWRQWIGPNWGTNIIAERYHNTFYDRTGLTIGLFKDFAL